MKRLLLFAFLATCYLYTQSKINFNSLTIEDGLANNSVRCLLKDHKGIMWFGTHSGLSRYDGYSFTNYRAEPGTATRLQSNKIFSLVEDHHHDLWIGGFFGLEKYDRHTGTFSTTFSIKGATKPGALSGKITALFEDSKKNLWVAIQQKGVYLKKGEQFERLSVANGDRLLAHVTFLSELTDGKMLIGFNNGLALFDGAKFDILFEKRGLFVRDVLCDGDKFYAATNYGVYVYDAPTQKIAIYNRRSAEMSLAHNYCHAITKYQGKIWVGTDGGGINILDFERNKSEVIIPRNNGSLTSDAISGLMVDDGNRLWLTTFRGGVSIFDPLKNQFNVVSESLQKKRAIVHNFITSVCCAANGDIWIGTDGGGVSRILSGSGETVSYAFGKNCPELMGNNVTSIVEAPNGDILFGVYRGGLAKYNYKTGRFSRVKDDLEGIWTMLFDRDENLWIGTIGGGIHRLNNGETQFKRIDNLNWSVNSMCLNTDGRMWVGFASEGLALIDARGNVNKIYKEFDGRQRIVNSIRDIKMQGDWVWLGVENTGLVRFNPANMEFKIFDENHGLPNNSVLSIEVDSTGMLWLGTYNGLCRFNPKTQKCLNFYKQDGLPAGQFGYSSSAMVGDELWMGTIGGAIRFNPNKIEGHKALPPVSVAGFKVFNHQFTAERFADISIKGELFDYKEITLPYNKAYFTIEYVCPEMSSPGAVNYAYKLDGFDREWNVVGNQRFASYTNVKPGVYTFRVKAGIDGNLETANATTLRIKVLPPWWWSWWAVLLYCTFAAGMVWLAWRITKERLFLRQKIELAEFSRKKEHELNEEKLRFFTNISHEFRTPLSLIHSGTEEAINHVGNATKQPEILRLVLNNSKRMLLLVNQLINFRKGENGMLGLKVRHFDLNRFVREVGMVFNIRAEQKNIDFRIEIANAEAAGWCDSEKLDIIVFNLLSNAFKFTPNGGEITLKLDVAAEGIIISVSDNGPGIPMHEQEHIFTRFYQGRESRMQNTGSGIGLSLVKSYVEVHKGKIELESQLGKGSCFNVYLPTQKSAYQSDEMMDDTGVSAEVHHQILPVEEKEMAQLPKKWEDYLGDKKPSLLLVEDNAELRTFIAGYLADFFHIKEAENGEDGLEKVLKYQPDLVVSDVMMPLMDGTEMCKRIKANIEVSHTPVLLLTAKATDEAQEEGFLAGADDYITKPFSANMLRLRLHNILENKQRLHRFFNQTNAEINDSGLADPERDFIQNVVALIFDNLDNPEFNVTKLTQLVGMSQSVFYKKIKSLTGMSINEFIRVNRLKKAAAFLKSRQMNVTEAATATGFSDMKYFRECFKKQFGVTPSKYVVEGV